MSLSINSLTKSPWLLGLADPEAGKEGIHNGFLHSDSFRGDGGTNDMVQFDKS